MCRFDLVIRNGTVVTATDVSECDVGIEAGRISAIGRRLLGGTRVIDASGRLVLPGGIDSHVHIEQPRPNGDVSPDSFCSATASAAFGGTTCVISFAPQFKGGSLKENVEAYHNRARESLIDYSFHLLVTDPNDHLIENELPVLIAAGHRSIKMFMSYEQFHLSDAQVLKVLSVARKHGAIVAVHAENHDAIRWMTECLISAGLTSPKYHAFAQPRLVEREAVHRIIALAELVDVPIQVFHVTCEEAAEEIRRAQDRGLKVSAETCPQYLTFTAQDLDRPGWEGAKFVCSPPLRRTWDQEALWRHLAAGTIGVVSSDHAPHNFGGENGKGALAAGGFTSIPNGLPGLETRMPLLFSEGVLKNRIDLNTFVALTSTNAAKLFGLYPKKGSIAIGMDGDVTIWDPNLTVTVSNECLHHNGDYTPLEGIDLTGWPVTTLVRGVPIVENRQLVGKSGFGSFVPRMPYAAATPKGLFPTGFNPFLN